MEGDSTPASAASASHEIEMSIPDGSSNGKQIATARPKIWLIWAGYAATVICLSGLVAWTSWQSRKNILSSARQTTLNLARVLNQHTVRTFENIDMLMRLVEVRLTQVATGADGGPPWRQADVRAMVMRGAPFVASIRAIDVASGRIIFRMDQPGIDAADDIAGIDSEATAFHRSEPPQTIRIGGPIESGRTKGVWRLGVSRRLGAPGADPAGGTVIVADLSLDYLQRFYDSIDVGNGAVALVRADAMLITRRPFVAANVGRTFSSSLVGEALKARSEGTVEGGAATDGVVRIIGFQRLEEWPLYVLASLDRSEVLAPWRVDAERDAAIAAAVLLLLGFGLFKLTRETRRRAEAESIRHREADRLRATLDFMAQGLIMVGADKRIGVYNRRALEFLDIPREFMETAPTAADLLAFQEKQGEFAGLSENLRPNLDPLGSGEQGAAYVRRRPNGRVLEIRTRPLPGGGAVRTYTDVTERKAMEDALAESEERYRFLTESTSDTITRLSLDFKREYVSPTAFDLFGFTPEKMLGSQPSDSVYPEDAPALRALAQRLVAGEFADDKTTTTYRAKHKDGRWIWIEAGMRLARDPATGEASAIVCSLRDATARRIAEQALQDSEARFRTLADNATDIISRLGLDLKRLYVSPSSLEVLGYSPAELIEEQPMEITHPEDAAKLGAVLTQLARGEADTGACLYRLKRKDGAWIWAEGRFRLHRNYDGSPREIFASGRDVTEREAQAEELRLAKEKAEAASKAKSAFVATMSHEIRTPLNAVIGFTGLILERDDLPGEARRQLELIRASGWSLLTVVNDILDFSKIEAGAIEIEVRAFDPRRLANDCVGVVGGLAQQKGLRLDVDYDPALPTLVSGDEDRLRQVVLNLLNNALKFTTQGSVKLSITIGEGDRTIFAVTDTGVGVPRDKQHRLFQDFSQIDASAKRQFGGTGLGLVICKRLVELMGGDIGIESDDGKGARFWFSIPLAAALEEEDVGHHAKIVDRVIAPRRVLVVDDMEVNRELAASVLRAAGHHVDCASDAESAVAAARGGVYDVIFMDIQMPGVDGIEAMRRIRALGGAAANTPIVALTANVYADQIEALGEAGMDGHLGKPFNPAELRAAVDAFASLCDVHPRIASEPTTPTIDATAREEMSSLLGPEKYASLVAAFTRDLALRFASEDRATLSEDAHKIVASAGMLGFLALSQAARALEDACQGRDDVDPAERLLDVLRLQRAALEEASRVA